MAISIQLLRDSEIKRLETETVKNIYDGRYADKGFEDYFDEKNIITLKGTTLDQQKLKTLIFDKGGQHDAKNAKIMFEALQGLSAYHAMDRRLWIYLAHTNCKDFLLSRAQLETKDDVSEKKKLVDKHFLVSASENYRIIQSRYDLSKLWWAAYMCNLYSDMPLADSLEVFCHLSDFRLQTLERPNLWSYRANFRALLRVAKKRFNRSQKESKFFNRENYREWMVRISMHGGGRLLSVLPEVELEKLFNKVADEIEGKDI